MTILSDTGRGLVHPGYEKTISLMYVPLANSFYDKFKEKDIKVIKRYNKILSTQNIFDGLFGFNDGRLVKLAAVRRIIYENNQKNLELKNYSQDKK